jgi:hypothetical protein
LRSLRPSRGATVCLEANAVCTIPGGEA